MQLFYISRKNHVQPPGFKQNSWGTSALCERSAMRIQRLWALPHWWFSHWWYVLGSPVIYFWRLSSGWDSFKSLDFERRHFRGLQWQLGALRVPLAKDLRDSFRGWCGFQTLHHFMFPLIVVSGESMANPLSFVFGIPCMLEACNLNGCKNWMHPI